jgi:tetratricopeptide (TPR) repeat protein
VIADPSAGAEVPASGEAGSTAVGEIPGEAPPAPGNGTSEAPEAGAAPETSDPASVSAAANPSAAAAPTAAPAEPAAFSGGLERIERAWRRPSASLDDRVMLTRRTSLELGVWNLDAAARGLLASEAGTDPLERAIAGVQLAPDLPMARMTLARALWLHGDSPLAAARAAFGALAAIPRHLEASLWFAGCLLFVLGLSLIAGGLWYITLVAGAASPHAAHDLGDLLSGSMPGFARVALLAAALLVPLALGEGLLGLCAAGMALGVVYGGLRQRLVLFMAASIVVMGAFPVIHYAGNTLTAFSGDPVSEAAFATSRGFTHPVHQLRIEAAAEHDPLAAQALALRARRSGDLEAADAHYQALLRQAAEDPVVVNNAANVRLDLGRMESALTLYRRSVELHRDPIVLFNLSQAHGRAFQVEELSRTLAEAQQLNGDLLAELTALQGAEPVGFVVDLPIDSRQIWRRIFRSNQGQRIAAEFRASLAPGRLGEDSPTAVGVFAAVLVVFALLGSWMRRSHWCARCGRRMCQRCDPEMGGGTVCGGCTRLFHQSETTDRELRLARINELRNREERLERFKVIASFLVPGVAGLVAKRPLRCLLGSIFAAIAVLALYWRDGVVPDPLVAGAAAPFASLCIAALALLAYAVVVLLSLATRRNA